MVFDLKTLKAQMAKRQAELDEYNRLHPKSDALEREDSDVAEGPTEGISPQLTDGQFKDDSDTAQIAGIKLGDNLGQFNDVIEEGLPTSR
jgi:hypothetical protein